MSNSMFANPKVALGFAGVTIVIAVAASFAASTLIPGSSAEPEVVAQPEVAKAAPAQPAPQTGWADDGFADDWDASAVDTASSFGSTAPETTPDEQPEFGDYSGAETSGSEQGRRGSASGSGPRIRSGAAPNAPPLPTSGASENASLEIVE